MLQLLEHHAFHEYGDNLDWFGPQVSMSLPPMLFLAHHELMQKATASVAIPQMYSLLAWVRSNRALNSMYYWTVSEDTHIYTIVTHTYTCCRKYSKFGRSSVTWTETVMAC